MRATGSHKLGPHWLNPEDRRKLGQSRRKQLRRQDQDALNPKARRIDALTLLERAAKGRLPALVKLKFERMAASPFAYFRGAAAVMAADLATLPTTGILTQICGDAHVRNLGAYAAPDGRLVFDINDFDETIRAPFEWELKRMVSSLVLAGRESGHKESAARDAAAQCIIHYCATMRAFTQMPFLDVAHYQVHVEGAAINDALRKAERSTPLHTLDQLTEPAGEAGRRFKESKPALTRVTGRQAQAVLASLSPYRQMLAPERAHLLSLYRPVDVAFKVVGVGSVGLRDYCVYFEGNGPADPLFLQIKEEPASCYAPYLPEAHPPHQNGQRVAGGQRAMQLQSDPFLGWTEMAGRQYLVRQLNDHKAGIEVEDLAGKNLASYAHVCGELLARGHARSGDPLVLAGYLGSGNSFAEALAEFASRYADQTEKDWEELKKHGKKGQRGKGTKKAAQHPHRTTEKPK